MNTIVALIKLTVSGGRGGVQHLHSFLHSIDISQPSVKYEALKAKSPNPDCLPPLHGNSGATFVYSEVEEIGIKQKLIKE